MNFQRIRNKDWSIEQKVWHCTKIIRCWDIGVRLGISYPEITEIWVRSHLGSSSRNSIRGVKAVLEIMIPVVMGGFELKHQKDNVDAVHAELCEKFNVKNQFLVWFHDETPRGHIER